jgi:hypothetical protein
MQGLRIFNAVMLLGGLTGCVAATHPVAVMPGPAKTEAAFRQDVAACHAAAVAPPPVANPVTVVSRPAGAAPGNGQAAAQPAAAQFPTLPPDAAYLNCMTAHDNAVVPLAQVQPAYPPFPVYPGYPVYAGFGGYYPWLYGDDVAGYGFYGGCCGWYGGGYRGGWYRGGFRR